MHPGILVGAGFVLGSLGLKAVTSKPAKKLYVKGIVAGMQAKEGVETMIDEAKAEFDDIMAEAGYEKAEGGCYEKIAAEAEAEEAAEEPAAE